MDKKQKNSIKQEITQLFEQQAILKREVLKMQFFEDKKEFEIPSKGKVSYHHQKNSDF